MYIVYNCFVINPQTFNLYFTPSNNQFSQLDKRIFEKLLSNERYSCVGPIYTSLKNNPDEMMTSQSKMAAKRDKEWTNMFFLLNNVNTHTHTRTSSKCKCHKYWSINNRVTSGLRLAVHDIYIFELYEFLHYILRPKQVFVRGTINCLLFIHISRHSEFMT